MDLSRASLRAFQFASEIAVRYSATLLITDIVPAEEQFLVNYRRVMNDLEEEIRKSFPRAGGTESLDVRRIVLINHGGIGSSLAVGASQQNVDFIVLGTHGRTGLKKFTEGSKAEEIAQSVTIPVLTIGPEVSRSPGFKKLLYVTDFSSTSANAIPYAVSLARMYGASLDVLHVNDPGFEESPRQAAEGISRFVRDEIRNRGFSDVFGREELLFGERTERIVQFAADRNVDLIVMGQKRTSAIRARIAAHLPGGVTYNVITQARCAVLIVPDSVLQRDATQLE
jgi:nucleotide-binding universal stress UspA family protein